MAASWSYDGAGALSVDLTGLPVGRAHTLRCYIGDSLQIATAVSGNADGSGNLTLALTDVGAGTYAGLLAAPDRFWALVTDALTDQVAAQVCQHGTAGVFTSTVVLVYDTGANTVTVSFSPAPSSAYHVWEDSSGSFIRHLEGPFTPGELASFTVTLTGSPVRPFAFVLLNDGLFRSGYGPHGYSYGVDAACLDPGTGRPYTEPNRGPGNPPDTLGLGVIDAYSRTPLQFAGGSSAVVIQDGDEFLSSPLDLVEFAGKDWWCTIVSVWSSAAGTTVDYRARVVCWDGAGISNYDIPVSSVLGEDAAFYLAHGDGEFQPTPQLATDGTSLWVIFQELATVPNPYGAGTWRQARPAVARWNGAGFSYLGNVPAEANNQNTVNGFAAANIVGFYGGLESVADAAAPGILYVLWSEKGHRGNAADLVNSSTGGDASNTFLDRTVVSAFDTAGRLWDVNVHADVVSDYQYFTTGSYPDEYVTWTDVYHTNVDPAGSEASASIYAGSASYPSMVGQGQYSLTLDAHGLLVYLPRCRIRARRVAEGGGSFQLEDTTLTIEIWTVDGTTGFGTRLDVIDLLPTPQETAQGLDNYSDEQSVLWGLAVEPHAHDYGDGIGSQRTLFASFSPDTRNNPYGGGILIRTHALWVTPDGTRHGPYDGDPVAQLVNVSSLTSFDASQELAAWTERRIFTDRYHQTWAFHVDGTGITGFNFQNGVVFDRKCKRDWVRSGPLTSQEASPPIGGVQGMLPRQLIIGADTDTIRFGTVGYPSVFANYDQRWIATARICRGCGSCGARQLAIKQRLPQAPA